MRRIILISIMVAVTLFAVAEVFVLKITVDNNNTIEVLTDDIEKMSFATYVETPSIKCERTGLNSYRIEWNEVDNADYYKWHIDDNSAVVTTETFAELDHLPAGEHKITVISATESDFYIDSDPVSEIISVSQEEEAFSTQENVKKYIELIFKCLPYEAEYQGGNSPNFDQRYFYGGDASVGTAMSDEALFSWTMWVSYLAFRTGDNTPDTPNYNNWGFLYDGIKKAGNVISMISKCPEINEEQAKQSIAVARVLRSYCYFQLFRRFGPVIIMDGDNENIELEKLDRNTVDENVDYMISELDKAIIDLPEISADQTDFTESVTKGAAMALKSRILLYAASPLFNGCDLYKGLMVNQSGKNLFPQTYDGAKWEKAAEAAKAVIDLNLYSLQQKHGGADFMTDAIKSYQSIQFEAYNNEAIWGYEPRMGAATYPINIFNRQRMLPPQYSRNSNGGYCASVKLFDAYPMQTTGRYPINPVTATEYDGLNPQIDPLSGYSIEGFEDNWKHPIEGTEFGNIKAHKSCVGRDARFYASILANGFLFINDKVVGGNRPVTFYTGGTSSFNPNDCVKSGLLWRRFVPEDNDYDNGEYGSYFWWYFRLGEIYLNYAEACNEKPSRDAAEALKYLNLIRNRAGLNNIEDAYPEYDFITDQNALRQMIRQERMVELAFEGHRYYDVRRWMTATKELTGKNWTLNLSKTNYEDSWTRTADLWQGKDNLFTEKNYFFPINSYQLDEMPAITQNYGW